MIHLYPTERKNPQNSTQPPLYYPTVLHTGRLDLNKLCAIITKRSNVGIIDVKSVLIALLEVIPEQLILGQIIDLGEFGSWRISVKGDGAKTAEELDISSVKQLMARFRAGTRFREILKQAEFDKVADQRPDFKLGRRS